jgi:hypothetical protein
MEKISLYNGWKKDDKVRFGEEIDERSQEKEREKVRIKKDKIIRKIITEEEVQK